jgi:hypothetical protein
MKNRIKTVKSFANIVVDFCTLPGAAIGAEILWIYTVQWKNRLSLIALALISFAYSNMYMTVSGNSRSSANEPENIR